MMNLERQKFSLKKNDSVQVMAGREKGKIGKILKIDSKTGRVTVEKTNMVKRHTKATAMQAGGIVEKELPLAYSNVLLFCEKCNRGVRHGVKFVEASAQGTEEKGSKKADSPKSSQKVKIRTCKRCNESLEQA